MLVQCGRPRTVEQAILLTVSGTPLHRCTDVTRKGLCVGTGSVSGSPARTGPHAARASSSAATIDHQLCSAGCVEADGSGTSIGATSTLGVSTAVVTAPGL